MKLKVLGSSSAGNCYILQNETEALILEAGISMPQIKKALDFNLSKAVAAIVTHSHLDHSGYIRQLMASGITVMALPDVFNAHDVPEGLSFKKDISAGKGYKVGGFKIFTFPVDHDVPCLGFIIDHSESGKILFVTDAIYCGYRFPGLNQIMIEANYCDPMLDENIKSGKIPLSLRGRLMGSHMEFETTKQILRNQDLSQVRNIILIHLSDGNSDEKRFVSEITVMTGKPVYAAQKGMEIYISKEPF
jgi:phosphoribosyl 1,2-cyclic phosphodiesterase